jgi:twitching motility protein PilT
MAALDEYFRLMVEKKASDLHFSTGAPPIFRISGEMTPIPGRPLTTNDKAREILWEIMPERNRDEFKQRHDTDFAYSLAGYGRFRCNIFMDRNGIGGVFRLIPDRILTVDDLKLSPEIRSLCFLSKGLVLVTGPTGSGKSTTLCALIDHVNQNRHDHIITIEDPIEFVHPNKRCLINQREVGINTSSFSTALRAALREDPDIVLVGEMRDLETTRIAIETAETGHLVFATLHTNTAPSTVDRLINQFPANEQEQIRQMLASSLKAVISQTLLKKVGGGRVAALEVLIVTAAVGANIREGKTYQIPSVMQTGGKQGMVVLNEALTRLVKARQVEPMEAYIKSIDKEDYLRRLSVEGISFSPPSAATPPPAPPPPPPPPPPGPRTELPLGHLYRLPCDPPDLLALRALPGAGDLELLALPQHGHLDGPAVGDVLHPDAQAVNRVVAGEALAVEADEEVARLHPRLPGHAVGHHLGQLDRGIAGVDRQPVGLGVGDLLAADPPSSERTYFFHSASRSPSGIPLNAASHASRWEVPPLRMSS